MKRLTFLILAVAAVTVPLSYELSNFFILLPLLGTAILFTFVYRRQIFAKPAFGVAYLLVVIWLIGSWLLFYADQRDSALHEPIEHPTLQTSGPQELFEDIESGLPYVDNRPSPLLLPEFFLVVWVGLAVYLVQRRPATSRKKVD